MQGALWYNSFNAKIPIPGVLRRNRALRRRLWNYHRTLHIPTAAAGDAMQSTTSRPDDWLDPVPCLIGAHIRKQLEAIEIALTAA